jgi:hypothetical protein
MYNKLFLNRVFEESVQLSSGLLVPKHSADDLIKSEVNKMRREENKASFFSKFALNNSVVMGAREKPQGTPQFAILYEAAEKSTLDRILIRARTDQQKRIWQKANEGKNKEIGFKVVHDRADDPDYKVTRQDKERCHEMEKFISDPTPTEHIYLYPHNVRPHTRLKDLVGVLTRTELIIDRKCILRYKRRDGQGYAAFHWLPGETIKNVDESIRAWAQKNESNGKVGRDTINKMSYSTGFDLARASYVQMIDGMITAAFTDDEISVHISNPSDRLNRWGYGTCVPWDTVVNTDMGKLRVGDIVSNKRQVKVESYNEVTGQVEWQPVVNWFTRSNKEELYRISWGTGKRGSLFRCTGNHPVLTPTGYITAESLKIGDEVMMSGPVLSQDQEQLLLGSLLGDAHLKISRKEGGYPAISIIHGKKQKEYFDWKVRSLAPTIGSWTKEVERKSSVGNFNKADVYQSQRHVTLWPMAELLRNGQREKQITRAWLDKIDVLGLAVWAMDDGSLKSNKVKAKNGNIWEGNGRFIFCTDGYSKEEVETVSEWLRQKWGFGNHIQCPPSTGKCRIIMTVQGTRDLLSLIEPYLTIQGTTKTWKAADIEQGNPNGAAPIKITNIDRILKKGSVYDIEVNQNHNFIVNGLIVHNSRLEESLDITTSLLMAFTYNREMFKTNYPEQVLTVSGDYDKEGLAAFKQQILGEAGGVGNNWRLPVIPAGDMENFKIESVKLRESPKDMLFDQMIRMMVMFKCSAYGAHPSTLNMETDSGAGGGSIFAGNASGEIEFSKEHGLIPSITDMAEWLTDALIKPRYDDLKLVVVGLNPEDAKQAVDIRTRRVSKWITKNECRMEEGGAPIGFYLPPEQYSKLQEGDVNKEKYDKNPWNYPADVPIPNYLNTFAQQQQAEEEPDQDEDQGDDQQGGDSDQYYKSMRKSQPETKFLKITLD